MVIELFLALLTILARKRGEPLHQCMTALHQCMPTEVSVTGQCAIPGKDI